MNDVPTMTTAFSAACAAMYCESSNDLKVVMFSRLYPGTIDNVLALCNMCKELQSAFIYPTSNQQLLPEKKKLTAYKLKWQKHY